MRPLPVESLAGAPPFVLGVVVLRGHPTPLVDLATLLSDDVSATPPTDSARFVTLRVGTRDVALNVHELLGIHALADDELEPLPPLWRGPHSPAVAALGVRDHELVIVLETARLLPEDWSRPDMAPSA